MAYLDNSATTKPCKAAVEAINKMLCECYGNPSSLHSMGVEAMKQVILARQAIADELSCEKDEIFFTSGGTEANNLAVFGAAEAGKRKGNRIVTTAIEHESVLQAVDELEKQGFEVIRIMPDSFGNISAQQIFDAVNDKTILVSIMYVNNEVGSILPVEAIKKAVKAKNAPALIHIDCVQAFGKIRVKPSKLGADLLTVTAHKIHGAKGTGALYVRKGVHIIPRAFGGEQEKKLRPGTECAPLIAGFGAAVKELSDIKKSREHVNELNSFARQELSKLGGITINSSENALEYILNITVEGIRSQTLIQFLSANDVYVSSGSACAKGKKSHVLTAMGLDNDRIDSAIRISFSRYNTKEDIILLCKMLTQAQEKLSRR